LEEFTLNHLIYVGNNSTLKICEKNIIIFNLLNGISKRIGDVLYVPKLAKNLLSINQLIEKSFKVEFEATKYWLTFFDSNKVITEVVQEGRLYKLVKVVQSLVAKCSTKIKKNYLWHQRLRHVYMQTLTTMEKNNFVESMDFNNDHDLNFYDRCVNRKHHHTQFLLSGSSCAKEILGLVHIDLCGPMAISHGGVIYLQPFIDDFLGKHFLIP